MSNAAPVAVLDRRTSKRRATLTAYAITAPGLLLLGVFIVYPVLSGFWTSLHNFDGVNPMEWVGADNYTRILSDPIFRSSLVHTVTFAVVVVVGKNVLGFLVATMLNRTFIGHKLIRTFLFMPIALNVIVIGSFWSFFLALDNGLLNTILRTIGLEGAAQAWLSDPKFALFAVAAVEIWRWLPLHVLIYLSGLQELPEEVNEAASLDGVGPVRRITQVVLPMLRPVIFVNIIISLTGAFVRSFELVWVLTQGTAETNIVLTTMYTEAFQYGRFGSAAAMGFVLFVVTALFSYLYVWLSRGGRDD